MPNRRQVLIGVSAVAAALPIGALVFQPLLSGVLGSRGDLMMRGAGSLAEMREILGGSPVALMTEMNVLAYCDPAVIESFGAAYLARFCSLSAIFDMTSKRESVSLTLACEDEQQRMLISYRDAAAERDIKSELIPSGIDLNEVARRLARDAATEGSKVGECQI